MSLHIGDTAPDFTAPTTQGEISFHEWLGDLLYREISALGGLWRPQAAPDHPNL